MRQQSQNHERSVSAPREPRHGIRPDAPRYPAGQRAWSGRQKLAEVLVGVALEIPLQQAVLGHRLPHALEEVRVSLLVRRVDVESAKIRRQGPAVNQRSLDQRERERLGADAAAAPVLPPLFKSLL